MKGAIVLEHSTQLVTSFQGLQGHVLGAHPRAATPQHPAHPTDCLVNLGDGTLGTGLVKTWNFVPNVVGQARRPDASN